MLRYGGILKLKRMGGTLPKLVGFTRATRKFRYAPPKIKRLTTRIGYWFYCKRGQIGRFRSQSRNL